MGIFEQLSHMKLSNLSNRQRNNLLIRITGLFWIIAKLMSRKLWLSDRIFPVVPPFHFLVVPSFVHLSLFVLSLAALLLLLRYPAAIKLQVCIIIIELCSCVLDQNRWQPWEYQYIFTLLIFIINRKNEMNSVVVLRWMLAAIYFYSGLGKINAGFANLAWQQTIWIHKLPFAYRAGYLPGVLEVLFGIGLLFKASLRPSAILLIIMHLLIFICFIAFNTNTIVLPLNIAMTAYLVVIVFTTPSFTTSVRSIVFSRNMLVLLLFGIMPAASFIGYWDYYLSSSLFSGRLPYMFIDIPKKDTAIVVESGGGQSSKLFPCDSNRVVVNVTHWAVKEMNVPVYPEIRVYKDIREQLLKLDPAIGDSFFIYSYRNGKKGLVEMP
jgi:uncharacterized membrane protein YphA (DoxX/SURF4 family)